MSEKDELIESLSTGKRPTGSTFKKLIDTMYSLIAKDGATGKTGDSAYKVAVNNGFTGTESEWLASLVGSKGATGPASTVPGPKGEDGAPGTPGTKGADGKDGTNGKSAYEVAKSNGFTGTEAEWLASLIGPKGATGPASTVAGPKGDPGTPGTNGADGKTGANGKDGIYPVQFSFTKTPEGVLTSGEVKMSDDSILPIEIK